MHKQAQYQVFPAFDGQEALEIMEKEHIDLIISDVMMPRMDGLELTSALRGAKMTCLFLFLRPRGRWRIWRRAFGPVQMIIWLSYEESGIKR